jgi:hypothetical protein
MKKVIMDENDNQANWLKILRKQVWKDIYIPKDLRKKYKIKYNVKKNLIIFTKRKK